MYLLSHRLRLFSFIKHIYISNKQLYNIYLQHFCLVGYDLPTFPSFIISPSIFFSFLLSSTFLVLMFKFIHAYLCCICLTCDAITFFVSLGEKKKTTWIKLFFVAKDRKDRNNILPVKRRTTRARTLKRSI